MKNSKEFEKKLRSAGLRPTKQRLSICNILYNRKDTFHFSIEELSKIIEKNVNSKISLATIYNTINAFKNMGVEILENRENIIINGKGLNSLKEPKSEIYLGNSGTSARLLTGLLSSQKFNSLITGDQSLSSRPMMRIVNPLSNMNAKIETTNGCLPIKINGQDKHQIKLQ